MDFEKHLDSLDRLLGPLVRPTETRVTIGTVFGKSALNRFTFDLYVGIRSEVYPSGKNYSPNKNLAILSHEYGHAILEKNLVLQLASYRQFKPEFLLMGLAEKKMQKHLDDLKGVVERHNNTSNELQRQALKKEAQEIYAKMEVISEPLNKVKKFWEISGALHEFFADAVTMTRHQDPKIIQDLLKNRYDPPTDGSLESLLQRDFLPGAKKRNLILWEKFNTQSAFEGKKYYSLLPARWEFWQLVKTRIHGPGYRAQIIPKVYTAVEKVLSEVLEWPPEKIQGPELQPDQIKNLNQRLIEELRASLGFN